MTWIEKLKQGESELMNSSKIIGILFILVMAFGLLPSSITETKIASAQGTPGFFEGKIPVQGAYLQTLACYPLRGEDKDEDGVYDVGCAWDDNRDGVNENHVVEAPLIVPLETHGFLPGDKIMISSKTSIYDPNFITWGFALYGLFSSSPDLLTENWIYTPSSGLKWPMVGPLDRVPGAIDAALGGYVHGAQDNWHDGRVPANDIPQDFQIGGYVMKNGGNWTGGDHWNSNMARVTNIFWIKIPPGAKYLFVSMPGPWNLGDEGEAMVQISKDTDDDALPDWWELMGIDFNMDGTYDLTLQDANYEKKDIYVEVDYMEGHRFNAVARDDVAAAFLNCPGTVKNGPISIHTEIDDSDKIPHSETIKWSYFKDLKNQFFGTNTQRTSYNSEFMMLSKKYAYHYCLFVHNYQKWDNKTWSTTTSGGLGEVFGNDFMVSLGSWTDGVGTVDEQSCTFMHELGHNLGLDHGGGDDINFKPNYMSIMNYLFLQEDFSLRNRPLTFSSKKMPDLNEANLDELAGLGGANWDWSARSTDTGNSVPKYKYAPTAVNTALQVDWDDSGDFNRSTQANVNYYPRYDYNSGASEVLHGYDDWSNLVFNFTETGNFRASFENVDLDDVDMTWEIAQAMKEDADNMVGGPTGPVQVLDVDVPSETSNDDSSPLSSNVVFIVVAIVILAAVGAGLLLFFKKRKHKAAT